MATEYISRDSVCLNKHVFYHPKDGIAQNNGYDPADWAIRISDVMDFPAADVVEVVRCRDCKHRPVVTDESHPYGFGLACPKEGAYQDVTCPYLCDDGYYNRMPADDWYCAGGERGDGNG